MPVILDRLFGPKNEPRTTKNERGNRIVYVPRLQAGVKVDHDTALSFSAVNACVRVIAEPISYMPSPVFVRMGNRRERMDTDPVNRVLNIRPNPELTPFSFKETLLAWALTWGNGYAEIVRDMAGRVAELWPIAPDRVEVDRTRDGRLVYDISNSRGPNDVIDPADVFHLHGMGFDGLCGYSVISYAARSIGVGMAAEEYAAGFFKNGTVLSGVLKHPGSLSQDAQDRLQEGWKKKHAGPGNAHSPAILEEGMEWQQISVPPEDAQLLQTQKFSVNTIARWFRVPPHKVADLDRATFSNIEHQSIEFVTDTILPWVTRFEQEANFKLFGQQTTQRFVKFNVNSLLRGDSQSRATFYRQMFDMGVFSPNDIRELEDLNPIPNGDKRLVQLNLTTLEQAGEQPEPEPEPEDDPMAHYKPMLAYAVGRCLRREQSRMKNVIEQGTNTEIADWADNFYSTDHRRYVAKTLTPAVMQAGEGIPESRLSALVAEYADEHLDESRACLFGNGVSAEDRSERDAQRLITRIKELSDVRD